MSNPSYPSVPEPSDNNVLDVLRTLKQTVELLTGQQKSKTFGAPRMFIQDTRPVQGDKGDLYINQTTKKLYYWSGTEWVALT